MTQPEFLNPFAEFWKVGDTSVLAEQMKVFESFGKGFAFPPGVLGAPDPRLEKATQQFRDLVEACTKLSQEIAPPSLSPEGDGTTAELLQRILDPREWLQATGLVDDVVRRLTEAPKFSDLWQMERRYLQLIKAWGEVRALSLDHSRLVLGGWSQAVAEFGSTLKANAETGASISRRDLVNQWVETANRTLMQVQNSSEYLDIQRKLLRASIDLRVAQRELAEYFGEILSLPTRTEVDDLARMVSELRREVRANKREAMSH